MTEADEAGAKLAGKGFFRRLIGGFTGSNQKLQNKINSSRAAAQYASQQTLQKLAEQNLMSFDLITAVNNKLNASMQSVGEGFQMIFTGLEKFFKHNRNEMVRLEMRMDKVERNVKLLTWQNSIEYLDFNGEEYTDMDDAKKIVCLVRDFYDITGGDYSTSDLLLLKTAMATIDIEPKSQVNYGAILEEIAESDVLKDKLLGGKRIRPISDPSYLIAMSGLQKMDALQNEEKYTVDTVAGYVSKYDSTITAEAISRDLTANYLRDAAGVDVNLELDSFDMVLDLLYNLKQAEEEHLLIAPEEAALALPEGEEAEPQEETKAEEKDPQLQAAEELFLDYKLEEAHKIFAELAEAGNGRAMYYLGEYADHGYAPEKEDEAKARGWWEKGAEAGDPLAAVCYAASLPNSSGKRKKILEEFAEKVLALADAVDPVAQNEAAQMYKEGCGVEKDEAKMEEYLAKSADTGFWLSQNQLGACYYREENYKEAFSWFEQAALAGYAAAQCNLGICYANGQGVKPDYNASFNWYVKAANAGDKVAQCNLGYCYTIGRGTEQNEYKAEEWYQKSADCGYAIAQCNLVTLQMKRKIRPWHKDKADYSNINSDEGKKRLKWYTMAANQGLPYAQYALGITYIWMDEEEPGKYWLQKAKENGEEKADEVLNKSWSSGEVVPQPEFIPMPQGFLSE